jgi:hypothetical protein
MRIITEDERQILLRLVLSAIMEQPSRQDRLIGILRKIGGVDKRITVEELR